MPEGNSPKAYNTVKAVTNIQQYKSAVIENSSYDIFTESTTVWNAGLWSSGLYNWELFKKVVEATSTVLC